MNRLPKLECLALLLLAAGSALSQSAYQVVPVDDGGKVVGTVKWSGPLPHMSRFAITKDPQVCDPEQQKTVDLERLVIGAQGGVANTVVFDTRRCSTGNRRIDGKSRAAAHLYRASHLAKENHRNAQRQQRSGFHSLRKVAVC